MSGDPRETALRALGRPRAGWWVTVLVLAGIVACGLYEWVGQLRHGMGVAGYNDQAFWAIYIANVVTFIGVSYGGAVVSAILRMTGATWRAPLTRLAEGTAVVTVVIGGAMIIPHIGRPDRLYELVTQPNVTAPVFWDFIAVSTYATASIVFFALPLVPDMAILHGVGRRRLGRLRDTVYARISRGWIGTVRQRRVLSGALGLVSILIVPLAVSVHSVLAWAFATTSRPWWHESIWAPQFVVAALYSGVALVILVVAGFRRGYRLHSLITPRHFVRLGFIMAALGATYLYLTFADILPGAYVGEKPTANIFGELIMGRLAGWFWLFVVVGGVLPLLLVALPWTRNVPGMVAAAILVVPMMWLKRLLMVIAPANFDVVDDTHGTYHFTGTAIAITLAAAAAIPLLLMLLFRLVPVLSIEEIEEMRRDRITEDEIAGMSTVDPSDIATAPATEREPAPVGATRLRRSGPTLVALLVLLVGAATIILGFARPAAAADTGPAVSLTAAEVNGVVTLTAKVTNAGAAVTSGNVAFLVSSTTFGPRQVQIGRAALDPTGTATLVLGGKDYTGYRPTTSGPYEFTATYVEHLGDTPAEFSTNIVVSVASSPYEPAPAEVLAPAGRNLVKALFVIVATVWLLLITQVIRVWWVCRVNPSRGSGASRSQFPRTVA